MLRLIAAVLMLVGGLGASDALAAKPISGGHYQFDAKLGGGDWASMDITLANDGREMAQPSFVRAHLDCTKTVLVDNEVLDGTWFAPYRSVQVSAGGQFAFRSASEGGRSRRLVAISGEFAPGGRVVVGSLSFRENKPCRSVRLPFRARLVGRPNAPHRGVRSVCDRARIRELRPGEGLDEAFRVYEQDAGCTAARETARRWRASPTCQGLATGASCQLPGAVCEAVRGGAFDALVSARCTRTSPSHGVMEFVHYEPCARPTTPNDEADVWMWAINLDCATATAFPVATLIGELDPPSGPCDPILKVPGKNVSCAPVAGFVCQARGIWFTSGTEVRARCVDSGDGFRALEFRYDLVF